jgi:alkanesulfonate monooxygenase SsuD/methylene tetrahydromethanopterin reductase-like flavin-dependent oxidoreductase (luciferase family)
MTIPQKIFRKKSRIGFNTRVAYTAEAGPAKGLQDGIALFKAAEDLGFDTGWAYQRHFDHYLSSPLPFFAAVGQRTSRIGLGSAVLPMRYQDPILLAEAAATTDLLTGGRLRLAVSTGEAAPWDALFGTVPTDARSEARRRQDLFLRALRGEVLAEVEGQEIRVTPHSPRLAGRILQGVSSLASAERAAALGLPLITGTVQHGQAEGEDFPTYQARIITAYRKVWARTWSAPAPPVAVAASILPARSAADRAALAGYDAERRAQGIAASRPSGALAPRPSPLGAQISPVYHGTPEAVAEAVLADPGLALADELILFLPPGFALAQTLPLLAEFAGLGPAFGHAPERPLK